MPIVEVLLGERVRQRLAEMARNGACRAGPKLGTLPQLEESSGRGSRSRRPPNCSDPGLTADWFVARPTPKTLTPVTVH